MTRRRQRIHRAQQHMLVLRDELNLELAKPEFVPDPGHPIDGNGRLLCRVCGWNADGGTCAHCGTDPRETQQAESAWRAAWGLA